MRRAPFYANYPNYPSFRSPHSNPYAHDPYNLPLLFPQQQQNRRPSPATSSPSHPHRSIINIPVFDSASTASRPPSPPNRKLAPEASTLDPVAAATCIQSRFHGYAVRIHRPFILLRTISASRKRLENLKLELESPGFSDKVKSNEKERLKFSESVMAVILQLDAIQGSIPEVRNQRKEATKVAIKLQDAMDAIMSQQERTDCNLADSVLAMNSEERLCSDVQAELQEATHSVQEDGIQPKDTINKMQEAETTIPRAQPDLLEVINEELSDENAPAEVMNEMQEELMIEGPTAGFLMRSHDEKFAAPQNESVKSMADAFCWKSTTLCDIDESNGIQVVGTNGICTAIMGSANAPCNQGDQNMQEEVRSLLADLNEERGVPPRVGDNIVTYISQDPIDVCQKGIKDLRQCTVLSSGTTNAENGPDAVNSPMVEELWNPDTHCLADKMQERPSTDSAALKKLSEKCGQLKFMLEKLLAQSKAQSKVICVPGDRLEMLEQKHEAGCQNNQQREKRKLKKGSKRRVRCRNDE
ncbi:hypothetical protein L7F22_050036 [Adiantum nelumboides]|nr:hypothetical protein [Adiantum nelumboides]